MASSLVRTRQDRCPGVLRPWPAPDGSLVRVRLIGGRVASRSLAALGAVAREYGDGRLHLTSRANLQLRGLPVEADGLPEEVVAAVERTGLLPSRAHDLVRNVMVSPLTGITGGRTDLRPVAAELDGWLLARAALAGLPGRFLFVLDDGRGDLVRQSADLGLVVLDGTRCQLRVGEGWGRVVPLAEAALALVDLAEEFLRVRGVGARAPWHVRELPQQLVEQSPPDPRLPRPARPLRHGPLPGADHVAVPGGVLEPRTLADLVMRCPELVVTPWHGVVVRVP